MEPGLLSLPLRGFVMLFGAALVIGSPSEGRGSEVALGGIAAILLATSMLGLAQLDAIPFDVESRRGTPGPPNQAVQGPRFGITLPF